MVEVKKSIAPIIIVLETPEEIDLFFHIVNYVPLDEKGYYPFHTYEATFNEVMNFRGKLWNLLTKLGIDAQTKKDC